MISDRPSLDPGFAPLVLKSREFKAKALACAQPQRIALALQRSEDSISRQELLLLPEDHPASSENFRQVERTLKFLLWAKGGWKVLVAGSPSLCQQLQNYYRDSVGGRFDASLMGEKIYGRAFEIVETPEALLPGEVETAQPLGRNWNGCRIGFDLGASDVKVAAVNEGTVVFSEEFPWNPRPQNDPQWHFDQIMKVLRVAASHLPRVDAIGGSSAGVFVNNRVKVASLFRGVPESLFQSRVRELFLEIRAAWGNIPLEVVNDGEVTALAGSMSLGKSAVLGLAMGSSQAAGYANREGNITPWLNELAFAPMDARENAPLDEWSGDRGCGVQYFSQQAVGRLIPASGLEITPESPLPERLVQVQDFMRKGDERAARIYQSIGVYLGYAAAQYRDFYDYDHLLILGRVTTGEGGNILIQNAQSILENKFPELSVSLHMPDEKEKRHGQAMAAASLPRINPEK